MCVWEIGECARILIALWCAICCILQNARRRNIQQSTADGDDNQQRNVYTPDTDTRT